jgi:membrane-associated protease RseP (regulator of RpoE activity)
MNMNRLRLTRILVVLAAVLALAAGTVAAVAATTDDDDEPTNGTPAQEETPDANASAWLGVVVAPSEEPAGVAVRHVAPESPAADAGLGRGDVITAIDGQAVADFEALANAVEAKAVGDTVTLSVIKNGVEEPDAEPSEVEVTLEARPSGEDIKQHIGGAIDGLFDRFVDGQFRYLDEDGNTVTVEVAAGTVISVSADEITIDVNGDEGERTFSIPDGVEVPEGLETGDSVAVVVKDGAVEHILRGGFLPLPFLPGLAPEGLPKFEGEGGILPGPFGGDGDGGALSVEVISGTVSSVSADEITLDAGGDQGEKTFPIPDGVEVPEGLETGEEATVVAQNGEVVKITEGGLPFDGELPFPLPFGDGEGLPFEVPDVMPDESPAPEAEAGFPQA